MAPRFVNLSRPTHVQCHMIVAGKSLFEAVAVKVMHNNVYQRGSSENINLHVLALLKSHETVPNEELLLQITGDRSKSVGSFEVLMNHLLKHGHLVSCQREYLSPVQLHQTATRAP